MTPRSARDYAGHLLRSLGRASGDPLAGGGAHPARRWAESGLMALTGRAGGPPRMCPAPLASCADGVGLALEALAPASGIATLARAERLAERAAIAGHARNGPVAPGGSCRLISAADGRLAVNLARPEDWALVPAWLETPEVRDWPDVEAVAAGACVRDLVSRARLMGLPAVAAAPPPAVTPPWFRVAARGPVREPAGVPLVVDLSALWAGPLCGQLLGRLGARVVKVESRTRPDGARRGPPAFFDLMNAGKESVALDFTRPEGVGALRALLERADIVIESARPRGLRQLGVDAEALVRRRPGLTWVSITGYGREAPGADWAGFGDDAAVAAGLSGLMKTATGEALIAGDAVADPLTGLHAALAAWAGHRAGGGRLLSLALHDVAAHCLRFGLPAGNDALRRRQAEWARCVEGAEPALPAARAAGAPAAESGVDTGRVLSELAPVTVNSINRRRDNDLVHG